MIRHFCRFVGQRHHSLTPLIRRLLDQGFVIYTEGPAGSEELNHLFRRAEPDAEEVADRLEAATRTRGGWLVLALENRPLLNFVYDDDWFFSLSLSFFDNPAVKLAEVQHKFLAAFTFADLQTALEAATAYLAEIAPRAFGYDLGLANKPFLQARLQGRRLVLQLVDLAAYLRIMLFFMQKGDLTVFVRSPLDLLRLFEELQEMIQYMADAFADRDLSLEIAIEKQVVFRAGAGVKPNLGGRFGPTAIQLEALARILAAIVPRRGE